MAVEEDGGSVGSPVGGADLADGERVFLRPAARPLLRPPNELADPLPAARTSPACAGSALTLGMRSQSDSSASQAGSSRSFPVTGRSLRRPLVGSGLETVQGTDARMQDLTPGPRAAAKPDSGDVAELLALGQRLELLQALVLDLADSLARDVERAPHLVERPRVLAVEPVAHLEHTAFAQGERAQEAGERLLAQRRLGGVVGRGRALVGEEGRTRTPPRRRPASRARSAPERSA